MWVVGGPVGVRRGRKGDVSLGKGESSTAPGVLIEPHWGSQWRRPVAMGSGWRGGGEVVAVVVVEVIAESACEL